MLNQFKANQSRLADRYIKSDNFPLIIMVDLQVSNIMLYNYKTKCSVMNFVLDTRLKIFWELEQPHLVLAIKTHEEVKCEKVLNNTALLIYCLNSIKKECGWIGQITGSRFGSIFSSGLKKAVQSRITELYRLWQNTWILGEINTATVPLVSLHLIVVTLDRVYSYRQTVQCYN